MKQIFVLLGCMSWAFLSSSQSDLIGNYTGVFNGDQVSLSLQSLGNGLVGGTMEDSQNKYEISGKVIKNNFNGTATEPTLGIQFEMKGTLQANIFNVVLIVDFLGEKHNMDVTFTKTQTKSSSPVTKAPTNVSATKPKDPNIVGAWVKESNYSSGYSSNNSYGSMSTRESMVFYANGSLGDGGSMTVVGGSDFSGYASGNGKGVIPGVFWWTENNKIWLHITENGKSQEVELGKYYIENGRMLITATNGEKMLLTKQ